MAFELISEFAPTGDQPEAIRQLVESAREGVQYQTLLGVTGSGKTFTIANMIAQLDRPTLILSHNKTLAAQLYGEFKHFFPTDRVEYFVSYYDYYQPEAYLPVTNTYIEKDLSINSEIEKLRLSTTSALLSGRRNVIVVASVSCIYGIGNPAEFHKSVVHVKKGQKVSRNALLRQFVSALYSRRDIDPARGNFRVRGDVVEVYLAYADPGMRIELWGDEIEKIERFSIENVKTLDQDRDDSLASRTFAMQLLIGFAGIGSLLTLVGIYGVLSLSVASRRRELAIRAAVGAAQRDLRNLVFAEGFRLIAGGVVSGIAAALILSRVLKSFLFQVEPADPATLILVGLLFVGVALLACWVPTRRAAKVDPLEALRYE